MAEGVGDGDGAVGVETRLISNGIGEADGAVARVAPVTAVLTVAEDVIQHLVNQWSRIKGDGSAKQVDGGLDNRQGAPLAGVGVINASGAHVEREIIADSPAEGASVG